MDRISKIKEIEIHVREVMRVLGMDIKDDSLKDTPNRVAKMWVNETFSGLSEPPPPVKMFRNKFGYSQMLVEHNIIVHSTCEHHWQPIIGYCHIGYIPKKLVIGLSKFHRIVQHYSRKPQIQERLGNQIAEHLQLVLGTKDVAVVIKAEHFCCKVRGVRDNESFTSTSSLGGVFMQPAVRAEFFNLIGQNLNK